MFPSAGPRTFLSLIAYRLSQQPAYSLLIAYKLLTQKEQLKRHEKRNSAYESGRRERITSRELLIVGRSHSMEKRTAPQGSRAAKAQR